MPELNPLRPQVTGLALPVPPVETDAAHATEPLQQNLRQPGLFENTVSAICYEIASSQTVHGGPAELPPYNDLTAFVLGQWRRMPRFLAWPVRIATLVFALNGLAQGALFHRLAPHKRFHQLESWRLSRLAPRRGFVRFYRSLALLALYSRPGTQEE